jgi:ANTAR domain
MTGGRATVVWGLIAAQAAANGRRVSVADVCAVAAGPVPGGGAWVVASDAGGPGFVMSVTDLVCEQLAELHLMLGEGPCHDVLASAAPVLAADLDDAEFVRRWPAFTPEARRLGAAAVFAFPLTIGAIRAGVMAVYHSLPSHLPDGQLGDLLILADAATILLLDGAEHAADASAGPAGTMELDGQPRDLALHRAEIDQATGMLTVQLGVTIADAFVRLRAYAYSQDRRLADVAGDIVARRLRLHADPVLDDAP